MRFAYRFGPLTPGLAPEVTVWGALTYVADHAGEALDLLVQQFKEKPRIEALLRSYVSQVQQIEDALWGLLLASDIDRAENAQLDGIGRLVGERRRGRSDVLYRAGIRIRILVNRSNGKHHEMLRILMLYTGATSGDGSLSLRDVAPAAMRLLFSTPPASAEDTRLLVRQIKPGGVEMDARYATSATRAYRFGWSGGDVATITGPLNGDGWSGGSGHGGLHAGRI